MQLSFKVAMGSCENAGFAQFLAPNSGFGLRQPPPHGQTLFSLRRHERWQIYRAA
jgi:hypothetical protein